MNPEPTCCAGLRQTLLHDWQQDFPLHETPFQLIARRLGAGVREVLQHCQALQEEGALHAIRLVWSERMQPVRWRLVYRLTGTADPGWEPALRELPGIAEVNVGEPLAGGTETAGTGITRWLWFDIVAHRRAHAEHQRAAVETRAGPAGSLLAVEVAAETRAPNCSTGTEYIAGCPCEDGPLAANAELALPLVAHPYRVLALGLGRSEREVVAALRRWRQDGYLAGASLARDDATGHHAQCLMALLPRHDGDRDLPGRLLARPGVVAVERFATQADAWWLVTASGMPRQAQHSLERALGVCAVPLPHRLLLVRRTRLRHAPLLFSAAAPAERPAP